MSNYKVAYPRGWRIIDKYLPNHNNLQPLNSPKSGLKFLNADRADIFVNIPFIIEPLLKKDEFINMGIKALKPAIDFQNLYIYILPKHDKAAKLISEALKTMKKDGTQDRILKE